MMIFNPVLLSIGLFMDSIAFSNFLKNNLNYSSPTLNLNNRCKLLKFLSNSIGRDALPAGSEHKMLLMVMAMRSKFSKNT